MRTLLFLCVCAAASTCVLSLSARNAQVMATLEQLEALLDSQLEVAQEQEYQDMAEKEELIAALQRACNRAGSGASIQSLSTLANMLSRDEVSTQEAMNILQAQGLYEVLESPTVPATKPVVPPNPAITKKALEKVVENKVKNDLKKAVENEIKGKLVKEAIKSPKFRQMLETGIPGAKPASPLGSIVKGLVSPGASNGGGGIAGGLLKALSPSMLKEMLAGLLVDQVDEQEYY